MEAILKPPVGALVDWADPINANLVLRYLLNENGGGAVKDIARNSTAVFANYAAGPVWGAGLPGQSPVFDGTNDNIVGASNIPFASTGITVSFWLKFSAHASYAAILGKTGNATSTALWDWGVFWSGASHKIGVSRNASYVEATTSALVAGVWQHVAVIASDTVCRVYINGVLFHTFGSGVGAGVTQNTAGRAMVVGGGGGYTTAGQIDNVFVADRLLTQTEIRRLYSNPWAGIHTGARRKTRAAAGAAPSNTITTASLPGGYGYMGSGQTRAILPAGLGYMG